ncbi:long-chain-fatty-acid--CoA ligase [Pseudoclavibacter endophyticus]|uniref:AMP-binding protein n=1 Tax=Pseudoclavibacter endophyticus TaxID=1778590 RepID=A0A6H9WGF8_9MICO|nr:long-chain-fatty-acid--CoA ligase [Pseudoclavibacter endophyticus]KAB1646681.1 AMP-binding protein [Pseudoclavibacter endophyticus]GGA76521.1 long-chain-fatty-acid--CoA ligase [Pseudoclavibacter endophyticus]
MQLNESRAWNRFYAPGTPKDIDVPNGSLADLLDEAAAAYRARDALVFFGAVTSYGKLREQVMRAAAGLRARGIRKGDRVALVMPNAPQHVIAFYAVLRLGAIVVEHNPLYTRDELRAQFQDHRAEVVIAWDKAAPTVQSIASEVGIREVISVDVTTAMPLKLRLALRLPIEKARESRAKLSAEAPGTTPFRSLLTAGTLDERTPGPDADDIACLQYTSGTTGTPKGAMITHRNLWSNARQGAAWMPDFRRGEETIYGVLPMFHAFGVLLSVIYSLSVGARTVLFPTFDPDLVVDAAKRHPATFIPAVPPMYDRLARVARDGRLDLTTVTYAISGAMTLNDAVVDRWETVAGGRLVEGFGLTECSPVALGNPFTPQRKTGTIGIPFPSTDIRVVDSNEPDRDVELGETGELLIRGPQVFSGYWNRPDETAQTLLAGGWLRTGDLVQQDEDGFVTVVDRKKELIITGGLNVSPSEVERVVAEVPGVAEVAVVGIKRGGGAEVVTAVIVLDDGATFDERTAREHAREHLAEYKVPRAYLVWDALPKSLIGKVLRKKVRDALQADPKATSAPEPSST